MMLPVNEIFDTLQGEASWTGAPSTFVRLQGCAVGCPWCDTRHTWELDKDSERSWTQMLSKTVDMSTYAIVEIGFLVDHLCVRQPRHVVITGGEPCQYDLGELTERLQDAGKTVQIETSGTQPVRADMRTFITVSPKVDMPGGFAVLDEVLGRAHEIKMPVGKPQDVETLAAIMQRLLHMDAGQPQVWLQPLSTSPKATALCVQAATERGWRVSLQMHKYAGLR